jgi:hypothetical protein
MRKIPEAVMMVLLAGALACPLSLRAQENPAVNKTTQPSVEEAAITAVLNNFLAHAADPEAHELFWSELVAYYNDGETLNKQQVVARVRKAKESRKAKDGAYTYSAEDIQIRTHETAATVEFRMVEHPPNGKVSLSHVSAVLVKNEALGWQAIEWNVTPDHPAK